MKIDRIDVVRLHYPLHGYFKFFRPGARYQVLLVKITADNGAVGWGESLPVPTWSCESPDLAELVLRQHFVPALLGLDPLDMAACQRALDKAMTWAFSTPMPLTRAGLDLALHDLQGKLTGRSLAELFGRQPGGPVTLSWTVDVRSLDEIEPTVQGGRERGYRNFNIKIGGNAQFDVEFAARMRRLAPDSFLWADANCGYDVLTALEVAPKLADVGVDVLESPLRPNRISGYQALKRQGALPITMDEGVISPVEVEEFIRLGMIDGLTVKVSRSAGLESARRQVEVVLDAGLFWLASGLSDPDVALAATLGLASAYGLAKPAALNGPQFVAGNILKQPLDIRGDQAFAPRGPGLGVDVDEKLVAALAVE